MGQKDVGEKVLEAYNDVFTDIVNVLLFHGDSIIKEEELEDAESRSAYKADGKYREIERDVSKRWKTENIRVACIGLENQTKTDSDMPLRVLAYDAAEYRSQLNQENQSVRYPVVTLVLYFDYKNMWDKPLTLYECMKVPEKFQPYVNDYKMNLFNIAYLDDEQLKLFHSDFRFVADYFVQMRKTGNYKPSKEEIRHVQETLSLMSILTQDRRFEDAFYDYQEAGGKEIKTMCEFLDKIVAEGKEEGRIEGRAEGRIEGRAEGARETARKLYSKGMLPDEIAGIVDYDVETICQWLGLASFHAKP